MLSEATVNNTPPSTTPNPAPAEGTEIGNGNATPQPPETKETKPQEKPDLSAARFAQLAKRERSIVKRDQEIKAREKELERLIAQQKEEEELWQKNPIEGLGKKGWDYQKLTQLVLNQEKPTADMVAREEARKAIEDYKRQQDERLKAEAEEQAKLAKQQYDEAVANYKKDVVSYIKDHAETYELLNVWDENCDYVVAVVEEHFQKEKKVLSNKEACDLVEKWFEDKIGKCLETKKFSKKGTPQPEKVESKSEETASNRTLNNNLTSGSPVLTRPLSREERIQRALNLKV